MPRKNPGAPCQVCNKPSHAKNLCSTHYMRWLRHGHTMNTRPNDWGNKEKHTLYSSWCWTNRTKEGRSIEWGDFWTFVNDVGERPSKKHVLRRYDIKKPFGVDNFYWKEPLNRCPNKKSGSAAYQREYRKNYPQKCKSYSLKRSYNITIEDYDRMLDEQDHKCGICNQLESIVIKGKIVALAVDHCHKTNKIRGLLCINCNRGLGYFKDNPDILKKAVEYCKKQ